jgi:uncharacterized protein
MYFGDPTFLLAIPALLLAFYAQSKVKSAYAKYSQVFASSRLTGAQAANQLLQAAGAAQVTIEKTPGQLTDHYDPRKKVLRLSVGVHDSASIAALGIAAHETGHAIQDHAHYQPMALRAIIYPVARIGSTLAFPIFLAGLLFSGHSSVLLMNIGILLFAGALAFTVVTLPVEFDASKRALALLGDHRLLTPDELAGAKKVLSAAALTYVASTASAASQLLRMVLLRGSRD